MSAERELSIVQVSTADAGGGAERIAADLHRASRARGIDSTLAVGHRFGNDAHTVLIPNDARRNAWARAVLRLVPQSGALFGQRGAAQRTYRRAVMSVAEPGRAWRRLRGFEDFDYPGTAEVAALGAAPADIVHLHNLHGSYFDLRCLPAISGATPTVITAHDTWLASGHCAYALDCTRWLTGCGDCPYLWTPPAIPRDRTAPNLALKRGIYRRSHVHLVGPSRWVLGELERSVFAEAIVDAHHIPNGVDQQVFSPAPDGREAAKAALGIEPGALVLVFSATTGANPYKDFDTVKAALPRIIAAVAPRNVVLMALGGFPAGESVRGATVLSVPYSPDPQFVADRLRAADLAIHSARAENHPLAILEAQSCGVPVVASRVGGVPETLVDGETGLLVAPQDVTDLAAAVGALLTDDPRRHAMASAAHIHARADFGLELMVDRYLDLYRAIAPAHNGGQS